jgi:hypothetical protein
MNHQTYRFLAVLSCSVTLLFSGSSDMILLRSFSAAWALIFSTPSRMARLTPAKEKQHRSMRRSKGRCHMFKKRSLLRGQRVLRLKSTHDVRETCPKIRISLPMVWRNCTNGLPFQCFGVFDCGAPPAPPHRTTAARSGDVCFVSEFGELHVLFHAVWSGLLFV